MHAQEAILLALAAVTLAEYAGADYDYRKPELQKYPPQPYKFGYETKDDYGATQFRKESGDANGNVQGSYGFKDSTGIERVVDYVADDKGFRARVQTNEPGTEDKDPADVEFIANPIVVDFAPLKLYESKPVPAVVVPPKPTITRDRPFYGFQKKN